MNTLKQTEKMLSLVSKTLFIALMTISVIGFTSCSDDEDEPEAFKVVSTTPDDGATGVSVGTTIVIEFNKPVIDISELFNNAIILLDNRGFLVDAQVSSSGSRISINPDSDLDFGSDYSVGMDTSVSSESGEEIQGVYQFSFTTESN